MRSYNDRMGAEFMTNGEVERARIAMAAVALDCERGKHRTETDAETGDEVCRFCGMAVEP